MGNSLSERTESILIKSGWHNGRSVDVESIDRELLDLYGLRMSPLVRRFVMEYSGIVVRLPDDNGVLVRMMECNPIKAANEIKDILEDQVWRSRLCHLVKGNIYPVCVVPCAVVLLREDGAAFAIDDLITWINFLGHTYEEAIENLCSEYINLNGIAIDADLTLMSIPGENYEKVREQW